jgi:hypothetical protein
MTYVGRLSDYQAEDILSRLSDILGVQEAVDLEKYQEMEGTCKWIQEKDEYQTWLGVSSDASYILWLTGLPGTGKSTLAKSIVGSLNRVENGDSHSCQYHFFSFSDALERKVAYALRSIAFQIALGNEPFRKQLLELHEKTGIKFDQQEMQFVWSKIFEGIVLKIDFDHPLYWVLDGLDEADTPVSLVNAVIHARPRSSVKILLTSRPTRDLITLATSRKPCLRHAPLTERDTMDDIRLYVRNRIQDVLPIDEEMKGLVADQMFEKASGSFLWAKLASKTLEQNWHTEEDIQRALNDVPEGMQSIFERMTDSIKSLKLENPRNYAMACRILSWATCSAEPLTAAELAAALEPDFKGFVNLEVTILHLCGQFLVTTGSKISLVHETAKSFLLDTKEGRMPFLDSYACHEHLAKVCINYLCNDKWKNFLFKVQESDSSLKVISASRLSLFLSENPFLDYAVTHWAYHVSHADVESKELLILLQGFFDRYILSWIHACVILKGLRVITRSAQYIKAYGRRRISKLLPATPVSLSEDDNNFFQLWAVDLIRVVGKFGRNLSENPSSIYKIIPPLCPQGSMLFKTYAGGGKSVS